MTRGPPAPKSPDYSAVAFRLTPALHQAAREAAAALGITMAEWIREAMRERLTEPKSRRGAA